MTETSIVLKGTLSSMIRHIKVHNRAISNEAISKLSPKELVDLCQPLHRPGYAKLLFKEGVITWEECCQYQKSNHNG